MKWDRTSHEFNFSQISKLSWKGSHSPRSCFNLLKRLQARVNGLITWDEEREREVERIESVVASVDANPWHSGSFTGGQKSRVRGRDDRANRCLAVKRISFVESQLARVRKCNAYRGACNANLARTR